MMSKKRSRLVSAVLAAALLLPATSAMAGSNCAWDFDNSGAIDFPDLLTLLAHWNDPWIFGHLVNLLANWGPC